MNDIMINLLNNKDIYKNTIAYIEQLNTINFIDIISNIKKEKLYTSKFHGLYHSEKVCFFASILALSLGLNEVDMQIIIDAALYHDIGRHNEYEDDFHGLISANKIDSVIISNPIYKEKDNLNILKAIIDGHSRDEKYKKETSIDYDVINYDRYSVLYDILKDADALDRTRFNSKDNEYLNKDLLRFDKSHELVDVAVSLNRYYINKIKENTYKNLELDNLTDTSIGCLHGIGFDFFRLINILKNGVLSIDEIQKRNIECSRNFIGNNKNFWISVIDEDMISNNNSGYEKFIKNGISLYCFVQKLIEGITPKVKSISNDVGLPTRSSEHEDEKFVYNEIPIENIYAILIPQSKINEKISNLEYMNSNLRYQIICDKVNYYYKMIKDYFGYENNRELADSILEEYKKVTSTCNYCTNYELNRYYEKLEQLAQNINDCIQVWFRDASIYTYDRELTVSELVEIMLINLKINYKKIDSGNELIYKVNLKKEFTNTNNLENQKKYQ